MSEISLSLAYKGFPYLALLPASLGRSYSFPELVSVSCSSFIGVVVVAVWIVSGFPSRRFGRNKWHCLLPLSLLLYLVYNLAFCRRINSSLVNYTTLVLAPFVAAVLVIVGSYSICSTYTGSWFVRVPITLV